MSTTQHQAEYRYDVGLYLNSTAIPKTFAGFGLWFHRSIHQGMLTSSPCSSSLAGQATLSLQYFAHQPNQRVTHDYNIRIETIVLCLVY
jgi:hypothetical protein